MPPVAEPIQAITLPPATDATCEETWLRDALLQWLDTEYLPEPVNAAIAERAAKVYFRQRLEGETDLGSLVIAIVMEMRSFDFSKSFYGEFAVANAVSDLIMKNLGLEPCCGEG